MKNAHIAFIGLPHRCHVNPAIPIVSSLVRRGHRVTYTTANRFELRVAASGAEVVLSPDMTDFEDDVRDSALCNLASHTFRRVAPFYNKNRPDLIVCDFAAFAGRILASRWRIPAIQMSPHFAYDYQHLSDQIRHPELRELAIRRCGLADEFLERHGVPAADSLCHREELNIFLFPKEFEPGNADDERYFYAGRCAGEQVAFGDWRKSGQDNRPVLLVATSTTYVRGLEYFSTCIGALCNSQWHVVLSIADDADPASFGQLPPNFEIVQCTSHTKILPHARLLIYMGGTISAAEAMYHGVPLLITSCGVQELEGYADNLQSLGLGLHLRKDELSVDRLRCSVIKILQDEAISHRVKQVQYRVRREPGGEETANRIEEHMELRCRRQHSA